MSNEFGTVMQQGYIVEDVAAAAHEWVTRVGAGPFYILDSVTQDQYYYRGKLTPLTLRLAFGYWGSMQIELVQQLNDADTLYSRAVKATPGKINHYATIVPDLEALLTKHKLHDRIAHAGSMPSGVKFVYLEEYAPGGLHLELIQSPAAAQAGFAAMEMISKSWDGKNPVRSMADLGADIAALQAGQA
jgi:hypothetical protein